MTIKDIASLAGVSPATVSKVLNNKADSIAEETREKVLRIVKEYNFRPFQKYIQNNSFFGGFVGLLLPGETREYSDFISGAQAAACAEGYSMVLCTCRSEADREKHLSSLFGKGVDGIVLYLDRETNFEELLADAPDKLVCVAATNLQSASGQCEAYCDFSAAAKLAVEHLIRFGHREIAVIGWRSHFLCEDLIAGYNKALYEHEIIKQSDSICLCDSSEEIMAFVRQFTCGSGTAFLCQDAQIAACVYRTLSHYGLQIPRDYSVIGLSAHSGPLDVFEPELTMMDVRFQDLGRSAVEALIGKIEGRHNMLEQLSPQLWPGASAASPLHTAGKRIIVVGSMNMDVIVHLTHIPTSGESLQAQRFLNLPGGKGANQGVGAAKLGGNVYAIGCLGSDQEGRLLYNSLVENGVNTAGVRIVHDKPTGKAYILVAENGESTIVRSYGANNDLQPDVVKAGAAYFEDAQFCLISMEMPWETVLYTIDFCLEKGIQTIVKPTTPRVIPAEVLKKITFLVPNEKELEVQISGSQPVEEKAASLFVSGAQNVIVTLGEKGCYLHSKALKRHFPAADFQAVDTTGAGDAFISALAVFLSEGHNIISSIQFATYAAGFSITRDGAQTALADRAAIDSYYEQQHSNDLVLEKN